MKSLVDAELVIKLDKEAGHKCSRYYIALFAPVIAFLKENPPTTVKVEYLAQNEAFDARFNHTQKDNPKPVLDKDAEFDKDAETAHNQDYKDKEPPGSSTSTGIASSMPTVEEKAEKPQDGGGLNIFEGGNRRKPETRTYGIVYSGIAFRGCTGCSTRRNGKGIAKGRGRSTFFFP